MDREIQNFIKGVNGKEASVWKKIYADYYSPLCHYAMKILNNQELAEDLVQGIIIKLWESPLCFENIVTFRLYLYKAVYNNCLKEIRDKEREDKHLKKWVFFTDEEVGSESLSAIVFEEVVRKLRKLIDEMPPKRREVILLSMKKMNNEEIGRQLDISLNTVKKHKKEAYAVIREAVKSDLFLFTILFC